MRTSSRIVGTSRRFLVGMQGVYLISKIFRQADVFLHWHLSLSLNRCPERFILPTVIAVARPRTGLRETRLAKCVERRDPNGSQSR